jgi:hypothetical protein
MAAKKIEVRLSNIVDEIQAASKKFEKVKGIRRSLSKKDQKQLALSIQQLKDAERYVLKACRTRMTAIFIPLPEEIE